MAWTSSCCARATAAQPQRGARQWSRKTPPGFGGMVEVVFSRFGGGGGVGWGKICCLFVVGPLGFWGTVEVKYVVFVVFWSTPASWPGG